MWLSRRVCPKIQFQNDVVQNTAVIICLLLMNLAQNCIFKQDWDFSAMRHDYYKLYDVQQT